MDPVIAAALRAALAVLFASAAAHKLRGLAGFRATLADYRVVPDRLAGPAAGVVVGAELAVAALFVTPGLHHAAAVAGAALLALYALAIGVNLARGRRDLDCGCAGPGARRPISGWLVARNLGLAAVALAGLVPVRARGLVWVDAVTLAGTTAALAALWAASERLAAEAPRLARLRGGK
jgi:hypothetical protein